MAKSMNILRADLTEARAIYDGRAKTPDGEAGAKAGAVNAVDAVVTFLVDSGVPSSDLEPLLHVLAAFRDHNRGRPNSLFDRVKRPGGGTHSQHGAWRAVVAATVTILLSAGVKKKDAAATVASSLKRAGIDGVAPNQVDSWHREISSERVVDLGAIQIYKDALAEAEAVHPHNPRRAADDLLAGLPGLSSPKEL